MQNHRNVMNWLRWLLKTVIGAMVVWGISSACVAMATDVTPVSMTHYFT